MTYTTKNCTDFIAKHAQLIGAAKSDTWKRRGKYLGSTGMMREFENQSGRTLTICEGSAGLYFYSLDGIEEVEASENVPSCVQDKDMGVKFVGRDATDSDVFDFIVECVQIDNSIVYPDAVADALGRSSWTVWQKWVRREVGAVAHKDSYLIEDMLEDMLEQMPEARELFYRDSSGDVLEILEENVAQVFWVGMRDYDTAYRIFVIQDTDGYLWLGNNMPD